MMNIKEGIDSLQHAHPEDRLIPLSTPWGEAIQQAEDRRVRTEYPRPQLRRDNYTILNGLWDYCILPLADSSVTPGRPIPADGQILVPFSPEALLSGVNRQLQPDEYLWYERRLSFSDRELARKDAGMRCILHFDAADQRADVYANGTPVFSHVGGYLPFETDITPFVGADSLLLQVRVRDESDETFLTRGKQTLARGGMFYTAQSGLWQTVWYEWVPANYVQSLKITPDPDHHQVLVECTSPKPFSSLSCTVYEPSKQDFTLSGEGTPSTEDDPAHSRRPLIGVATIRKSDKLEVLRLVLPEDSLSLWSPEDPFLYEFTIRADEDLIHSYFALRTFTVEPDDMGVKRFCLNHKPYFLHGLLDQGYWSDGLMTAPCDDAFLFDITLAKRAGFNMLRKHIKIEPLRWYYHCDRLGMIVWQDMVSGGTKYRMPLVCYMPTLFPHMLIHTKDHHYKLFSRADEAGRRNFEEECRETIKHLYSVPSIAVWVPFNEGWGQFDALRIAQMVKEADPTRPVDHASGWFDQRGGDFRSIHNYFRRLSAKPDKKRAFVISEYGGYACRIPGHSSVERIYGYKKYDTPEEMSLAFQELMDKKLKPLERKGLSGAVYTQLSDVEEEVNGLVTYDRKVVKLPLPTASATPCARECRQESEMRQQKSTQSDCPYKHR